MIASFIHDLFAHGNVRVAPPVERSPRRQNPRLADFGPVEDESRIASALEEGERVRRQAFPAPLPRFLPAIARWSAECFYRACVAAAYRDLPAEELARFLESPLPPGDDADTHYTVDLVFQYLPDLWRLTRAAAPGDPLVALLEVWAARWPLSSVGMTIDGWLVVAETDRPTSGKRTPDRGATNEPSVVGPVAEPAVVPEPEALRIVCGHAGLLSCYVDRVLARRALDRLSDPRVSRAVRAAMAGHEDRFPAFSPQGRSAQQS